MTAPSLRRWGWALSALVLAVLATSASLLAWRAHRSLSAQPDDVLAALSDAIGLPVEADAVRVRWWPPGLVVYGLRIPDLSPLGPGDLVHADEARLSVGAWALVSGNVVVEEVEVLSPVVRLERGADGSWNWSSGADDAASTRTTSPNVARVEPAATRAARRYAADDETRFDVADLLISHGRVSFRDRAIPGVPELEISGTDAVLRRGPEGSTLEFRGDALGGPSGNVGGTLTVRDGSSEAEISAAAAAIPANRLLEVLQLARGSIPFGAVLEGPVGAELNARVPRKWPPGRARIDVRFDADDATVSIGEGSIRKAAGTPFRLELGLYAGEELLHLRRATLSSGDARIEVADPNEADEASSPRRGALRVTSSNLGAATVAQWVPMLAAVAPEGELSLAGTIAPGEPDTAVQLRLTGTDLGLRLGGTAASLAAAALDFDVRPAGRYTAGVSLEAIVGEDFHAQRLAVAVEGGAGAPVAVRVDGARGGRGETEIERLALECEVDGAHTEVRRLDVAGLGGTLRAQGAIEREGADGFTLRVAPRWDGLDFAGVLRLFGIEVDVQGLLAGRAVLAGRQGGDETFLQSLRGDFDVRLDRGEVPELNLARATVDNLGAIPGLRQAIARRAEEKAPALLARTSRIDALHAEGSFEDGAVSVARLRLDAPDYAITATGRVSFDGAVDLDGDLVLGDAATAALGSASGILAVLAPSGKAIRIPVSIEGRYPELVSAPSPAFVSDSLRGRGGDAERPGAGELLRRLLGVGGDRADDEARDASDP